jgi:ankyrin repeat protein
MIPHPQIGLVLSLLPANGFALEELDAASHLCKDLYFQNLLIDAVCNLRYGARGKTRLMHAAKVGDLERCKWLVSCGSDVNATCEHSWPWHTSFSPLSYAAAYGRVDCVEFLLSKGAHPDAYPRDDNWNALHSACKMGHLPVVRLLLEQGANPSTAVLGECSTTPLLLACQNGHAECVKELIRHGASVNSVRRQDGSTPLVIVCSTLQVKGEGGGDSLHSIAQSLIDHGADVNHVRFWDGLTALLGAAETGRVGLVALLLSHGALLDPPCVFDGGGGGGGGANYMGKTPLMVAACSGESTGPPICKLLLDRGAEVDEVQESSGKTALCFACERGFVSTVELLVEWGANVNHRAGRDGWTPLAFAARMNKGGVIAKLLECGASKSSEALQIAREWGHRGLATLLL